MTSGRQRATVSATAAEPSSCLSTRHLAEFAAGMGERVASRRGGWLADDAGEAVPERALDGLQRDRPLERGQRAEQRRARERAATPGAGDVARADAEHEGLRGVVQQLVGGPRGVDERPASGLEAGEDV